MPGHVGHLRYQYRSNRWFHTGCRGPGDPLREAELLVLISGKLAQLRAAWKLLQSYGADVPQTDGTLVNNR